MPRGVKRSPDQILESDIAKVDQAIEKATKQLNELKAKRKSLVKQKKEAELAKLHEAIAASGKSIEDVMDLIKKK